MIEERPERIEPSVEDAAGLMSEVILPPSSCEKFSVWNLVSTSASPYSTNIDKNQRMEGLPGSQLVNRPSKQQSSMKSNNIISPKPTQPCQ